ncbi:MAG: pectic acid lyase [Deltaproteobacteria bacterium]|nr:pectic acid lyase [Deltaproteobacteria bacterium]
MKRVCRVLWLLILAVVPACVQQPPGSASGYAQPSLAEQAAVALVHATTFFRTQVAVHGSYLWTYSADLKTRFGEVSVYDPRLSTAEKGATETQGWVQPPGTPAVGMAYLRAFEATGDPTYLEAAHEAALALAWTQLASGGWDYRIEFDPVKSPQWYYRRDVEAGDMNRGERYNTSTFDDNNSQSALRLLMQVDRALQRQDPEVHHAVEYGLAKLLEAQYPNGAWPQTYNGEPRTAAEHPVQQARYPAAWSRTSPGVEYGKFYTFNDDAICELIRTLLEAHRIYGKQKYLTAARAGGDFILRAQLPAPQPGWAQQYNWQMEPAWARKFEPPAVASAESGDVVHTLLDLYLYSGDEKYLTPIPSAVAWFQRSRLPDGRWARFYELQTNRPLYFTKQYELVYTDADLPTHYRFQSAYRIPNAIAYWEQVRREGRDQYLIAERRPRTLEERQRAAATLEPRVRAILGALDDRGRWVEDGTIRAKTFNRNVATLVEYLAVVWGRDLVDQLPPLR